MKPGSTIARLARRAAVRVTGPDWRPFLQGLLTQDVEGLRPGEMRFAALLTPQGRLLFDLFVDCESDEAARLDVDAVRRDELLKRLMLYRLRARVEITEDPAPVLAAWGGAPAGEGWRPDPRLAALGYRRIGEGVGGVNADEDAYDAWRLGLGVPDAALDCKPDGAYPIEADFDLLNGIDFKKGCFVGQETTSRMKRRGQIKTRMLPIAFDGPAPAWGAEVLAGELRAGEALSGRDGRAMALLRLDRIEGAALTVDGRPVRVDRPGWFEGAGVPTQSNSE
jgi:folate-binding protein YgfZ